MNLQARIALVSLSLLLGSSAWSSSAGAADEPRPRLEGRPAPHPNAPAAHPNALVPAAPTRRSVDGHGQVLDARYNHGRYYPPVGTVTHSLPPHYRPYYRGGVAYYFTGGVWYAPRGGAFVVVAPPMGLVISVLPPYYSTLWVAGVPYYYADNVYYTWQPDQNGYAVANPPDQADPSAAPPDGTDVSPSGQAPGGQTDMPDVIIYPKNGQSKDQQAADVYECQNWAKSQTGFDPTQPDGGASAGDADRSHANYDRALSACLQGRGYQLN